MAQNDALEKKNEVLKKNIENLIMAQNKKGLTQQDNQLMQRFIREYHHNSYSLR